MKVFEVLRNDIGSLSESQLQNRLKTVDWQYEFCDDFRRIAIGRRDMEVIENLVYQLWKREPEKAVRAWNEHCPFSPDIGVTPSFIFRLQAQEEMRDK